MTTDTDRLVRALISGDGAVIAAAAPSARASDDPVLLAAAALLEPASPELLARAAGRALDIRDRQVVAIASAHLAGDTERVGALAREHLLDHPDSVLVAWIASGAPQHRAPRPPADHHPLPSSATPPGVVMNRKHTAALLITAAVLTNVAFTALGSIFDYPDVLKQPVDEVLASFRSSQTAVMAWFTVLAASAALFAPIAVGVGRLSGRRAMRVAVPVGVAASVVQVIGLLRWPLLVPGFAADAASSDAGVAAAARDAFSTAHLVLGTVVGETLGYLLTAAWTLLVVTALGRRFAGRWFVVLGSVSAVLILAGVLSPLDLPAVDLANFAGYVVWSLWLVAFGVVLLRAPRARRTTTAEAAATVGA
jgi:hypothetical protein